MCVRVPVADVCDVRPRFSWTKAMVVVRESSGLVKKKKKAFQLSTVHRLWSDSDSLCFSACGKE